MQGKFTVSARAKQEIKDIYKNTVLKHGKRQAQTYTDGLQSTLQLLADMPDMGRKCDEIPEDRVIDGLEQSSYLMAGTPSRREYIFHYSGPVVGAIRVGQYKRHMAAAHGGLPGKAFFDIYKDPKEEHGVMAELLWSCNQWGQTRLILKI